MREGVGLAAAASGFFLSNAANGEPVAVVAGVTLVACSFGMLSSLSRVKARAAESRRALMLNAGAVWTAALVLAFRSESSLSGCALIGLGVGLAGTTVLEVIERGAIAIAQRLAGVETPVSSQEFHEKLGDVRQRAQKAVSELRALEKREKLLDDPDEPDRPTSDF